MPSFKEWLKHHSYRRELVKDIFPSEDELGKMTLKEIEEKYSEKIIHAAGKLGIDLTDKDVEDIICKFLGLVYIEPHISHYHLHM